MNYINRTLNTILLKGVNSLENLLEESMIHLHRQHKQLPAEKQCVIEGVRIKNDILTGKNILVVDDDVRSLFVLTTVLDRYNIIAITAENGKEAIDMINNEELKVEMVLMDI